LVLNLLASQIGDFFLPHPVFSIFIFHPLIINQTIMLFTIVFSLLKIP
jgi:hypothetical protein